MTVTFIEIENPDGLIVEHALIAHADGSFTSMTKEAYEVSQVEHLTEIVPADEPAAKSK